MNVETLRGLREIMFQAPAPIMMPLTPRRHGLVLHALAAETSQTSRR